MEQALLELRGVSRRISSEFYLRSVNLDLQPGEVHALVGRNASGKSTLLSVIMGVFPADTGEIYVNGKKTDIHSPTDANSSGIMMVAQNMQIFENLSVAENIFFGQEPMLFGVGGMISTKKMNAAAAELFEQMHVEINPLARAGSLTAAERQLAGIARAIISQARILMLDEPSTHLNADEKQRLYDAINHLKAQGKAFLIISHDLDEVLGVADRISVIESGEIRRTSPIGEFDKHSLIEAVYGIKVEDICHREPVEIGEEVLCLESLTGEAFKNVNLSLRRGQLTVLMGGAQSGKLELARTLAGLRKATGTIRLNGAPLVMQSPITAVKAGIALASTAADEAEIRESEQAVDAGKSDTRASRFGVAVKLAAADLGKVFGAYVGMGQHTEYMTGGNSQRELIERAMRKQAQVYILCEPSAGVDIPARMRIYYEINRLLQKGAAVLLLTTDLDEAFGLADRIVVLTGGQIVLDDEKNALTRERINSALVR